MTGGVDDLEPDVSDLEDAAVGHLDIGVLLRVRVPPPQLVPGMQRHRRLVALGHLQRGGHVVRVTVRADHGEHLAIADRAEHARRVAARVDDG